MRSPWRFGRWKEWKSIPQRFRLEPAGVWDYEEREQARLLDHQLITVDF
jgi:hypothetical protein